MRIPYKAGGFDRLGVDCWGLVWLVYQERLGITLPLDAMIQPKDKEAFNQRLAEGAGMAPWQIEVPVGEEQPYDVVLMREQVGGFEAHVGVITAPPFCLHIEAKTQARHDPIRDFGTVRADPMLKIRMTRIFRHEGRI